MTYYCPNCGNQIDSNVFLQATGQCLCSQCGDVVDLTTVSKNPLKELSELEAPLEEEKPLVQKDAVEVKEWIESDEQQKESYEVKEWIQEDEEPLTKDREEVNEGESVSEDWLTMHEDGAILRAFAETDWNSTESFRPIRLHLLECLRSLKLTSIRQDSITWSEDLEIRKLEGLLKYIEFCDQLEEAKSSFGLSASRLGLEEKSDDIFYSLAERCLGYFGSAKDEGWRPIVLKLRHSWTLTQKDIKNLTPFLKARRDNWEKARSCFDELESKVYKKLDEISKAADKTIERSVSNKDQSGCFIATATYGNENDKRVQQLRSFSYNATIN